MPDALNYSNAKNVKERFKVWKDTYQLEATEKGIFEDNIQAYQIGKDKYTLAIDTQPINSMNIKGKYHEFRTILRKHNVSRRENAFEVLVNLFLCKIVDETQNPEDLHFYWKGMAYDSYFDLVDRLQKLYKIGMQQFLQQDIIYVSQDDIDGAFWAIKQKPNATEQRIKELFQQLKFYKGLDFEFIKVSNKEKFEKNAKILIEIIQMWQGLRLTSTEENQFLGDMFEYFLDNGIKQSEGQFFTPIPICKFIVSALPLESMLQQHSEPLKVIDYACGSGHFLNEYGSQVSKLLKPIKDIDEPNSYYAQTYGIEKEDRLAKVSKVASFMYGRNEVNIIDADALISHENIKPESFDVLVANPPFAVEDFLQTIDEVEREKFKLFNLVNNPSNNNIQCFFLERAQQLLAPDSVMGVIVPSSILSNSDSIHIATREILLQHFDFLSIVELGSQTFGKTGTNTVVLFLRRKAQRPEQAVQFRNRVNNFFADWENEKASSGGAYLDTKVVEKYCQHTQIDFALYETLLRGELNTDLLAVEIFKDYQTDFNKQAEIVNLKKQKQFKAKTEADQQAELDKRLLNYLTNIEKDKLYYFMLTQYNAEVDNKARPLLVVKSPSDNKEQKKFLGYEWSSAKGNEGLSYLGGDTVFDINTPLFDPKNRENSEKISYVIRQNFNGEQVNIPEHLTPFVSQVYLHDVLDFSRKEFNKAFNLSAQSKVEIETKWDLVKLDEVAEIISGGTPDTQNPNFWDGDICWATLVDTKSKYLNDTSKKISQLGLEKSSAKLLPINTVIFSSRASIGEVSIAKVATSTNQGFKNFICDDSKIHYEYLYEVLKFYAKNIEHLAGGMTFKEVSKTSIANFKIPLPPLDIQQKIVQECEVLDQSARISESEISNLHKQVAQVIEQAQGTMTKLIDVTTKIGSGATPKGGESAYKDSGITLIRSQNVYDGAFLEKGLAFIDDEQAKKLENVTVESQDVLFNITGASVARCCVVQDKYLPARVNQHVAIIRANSEVLLPKFLQAVLVSKDYKAQLLNLAGGANTREAITKVELEEFKIPVPPLAEQEKIVEQIEALEAQIAQAQKVIDDAPQQKQAILQKYL